MDWKNKKILIIIGGIVMSVFLILLLILLFYFGYNSRVSNKIELVKIPYANQDIQPGVEVIPEMISVMSVPKSFLKGEFYEYSSEIVGMCVRDNTIVVAGSIFYEDLLIECPEEYYID